MQICTVSFDFTFLVPVQRGLRLVLIALLAVKRHKVIMLLDRSQRAHKHAVQKLTHVIAVLQLRCSYPRRPLSGIRGDFVHFAHKLFGTSLALHAITAFDMYSF